MRQPNTYYTMQKNIAVLLCSMFIAFGLASCSLSLPVAATSNPVGTKTGTSKATVILGMGTGGDASALAAARSAGITRIATVDLRRGTFLGIVTTYTCTVNGE